MRFPLLSTFLLSIGLLPAAAQQGYHAPRNFHDGRSRTYRRPPLRLSLSVNTAYYTGDLTNRWGDNDHELGAGLGVVRVLSPRVSLAFDVSYFHLGAKDFFPTRGFAFTSDNYLATALVRYNLLADRSLYVGLNHRATPLLVFAEAGLGALTYNPLTQQRGSALPPEPGNSYPALAGGLPVGGGLTLRPSAGFGITFEALYFFSSTDLLDGVSQRGNPARNDDFATGSVKLEFSLGGKRKGKPLVHGD